jgi:hypothetical protein
MANTPKRRRTKNKAPNAKRGPPEHFTGLKLEFLTSRALQFQLALDTKKQTEFYNKVTLDYIAKYEDDLTTLTINPPEDPPDPDDFIGDEIDNENLSAEDTTKKTEAFNKIRKVGYTNSNQ